MTPLAPGQLRHRISILAPTFTADARGERTPAWSVVATASARIEPLSGRELERAKGFGANVTHRVTLRYQPGILPKHEVQFGARRFTIQAVLNEDEKKIRLTLMCQEYL